MVNLRRNLNRPLTWDEMDENFASLDARGTSVRFFDTLQEALDLQPHLGNGVAFQVREETDPENYGFYVFDDREALGYRYLGERWSDEYLNEIEDQIDGFITEVNQRVDEVEDLVVGIGSGEGGKAYDSLADALAADIPDNVVFQTPEGYWRRDSSNTEGAEFLRPFPDELERFAGEFKLEQGGYNLTLEQPVNLPNRVRTSLFKGGGDFKVNEGYNIFWAGSFNDEGDYIGQIASQSTNRSEISFENDNWSMVVFSRTDNGNLNPSENIFESKGSGWEVLLKRGTFKHCFVVTGEFFNITPNTSQIEVLSGCLVLNNGSYEVPKTEVIDYSSVSGTTKFIVYNGGSNAFEVVALSLFNVLPREYSFVGFIRGSANNIFVNGLYSVDGKLIDVSKMSVPDPTTPSTPSIINTNFSLTGQVPELPQTPEDVLNVYDGLLENYPQWVSKEVIGKTRDVVRITVESNQMLPITMRVDDVSGLTQGMTVVIEDKEFIVSEVWSNDVGSIGDHLRLNPVSSPDVAVSGEIKNQQGGVITTYSRRVYNRYRCRLNNDVPVFISASSGNTIEGVFENTPSQYPSSGTLYDSNGEVIAEYSSVSVTEGDDINCYTFDFSSNRNENDVKNTLFLVGGLHGYEKKALLGHMSFFENLCDDWRGSEELMLLRNIRYTVIPAVNPWGIRKSTNYNAYGVDLNRNFTPGFSETNALYYRWSGPSPLSEPESNAIVDKLREDKESIFAFLDCHNDGSTIGGIMVSPDGDGILVNAISRNINNNINKEYPEIPSYIYGWSGGGNSVWSLSPNPVSGDSVLIDNRTLEGMQYIEGVGVDSISVGGVVYNRNPSLDEDLTNIYVRYNSTPNGSTARQANVEGVTHAYIMEFGIGFLEGDQLNKLQIEATTNVIASLAKALLT